jgi:predicted ATP-dependent protease
MIPRIKFDVLITIEDWSGALRTILDAAVEATTNKASQDRQDLQDLLLTFIKRSPAKIELLDTIAHEAVEDLAVAEISVSLERISSRSAELDRAVGLIDAVTAEAKKDARALQLESTLDALTKAKAAIEALSKLEKTLTAPDQTLLSKLKASGEGIAAVVKAIGPIPA